jgi:hypothetical protein
MKKWLTISFGCALLLGVFSYMARAGDDSGTLTAPGAKGTKTNSGAVKCEDGAAKAAGKLIACYQKCAQKEADTYVKKGATTGNEEACESACDTKYNTTIGKLKACPPCLNATTLKNSAEAWVENNVQPYCFSGTTGTIPFP